MGYLSDRQVANELVRIRDELEAATKVTGMMGYPKIEPRDLGFYYAKVEGTAARLDALLHREFSDELKAMAKEANPKPEPEPEKPATDVDINPDDIPF